MKPAAQDRSVPWSRAKGWLKTPGYFLSCKMQFFKIYLFIYLFWKCFQLQGRGLQCWESLTRSWSGVPSFCRETPSQVSQMSQNTGKPHFCFRCFSGLKQGERTRPHISKILKDIVVPGRKSVQLQYLLWFNISLNYKTCLEEHSHPGSAECGWVCKKNIFVWFHFHPNTSCQKSQLFKCHFTFLKIKSSIKIE